MSDDREKPPPLPMPRLISVAEVTLGRIEADKAENG